MPRAKEVSQSTKSMVYRSRSNLRKIEAKLHEMKEIVEYALVYDLTPNEVVKVNLPLGKLKKEVKSLEK